MVQTTKERRPKTLREFNNSRLIADDILTGKEFRRLRRKKVVII